MRSLIDSYRELEPDTLRLIFAELALQLLNTAYFTVFNFYLLAHDYQDESIAQLLSLRFLVVMLLSVPLGFFIHARKLLPLIRIAAVLTPLASFLILWATPQALHSWTKLGVVIQGASFAVIQVCMVPYIMRNEKPRRRAEAIALHFATWGVTGFVLGVGIFLANLFYQSKLDEGLLLAVISGLSLIGAVTLFRPMADSVTDSSSSFFSGRWRSYDWKWVIIALVPSLIMGVGAGLTIPFVSLFFYHVFSMDYDSFALMSALSTLLVTLGSVYGPRLLRNFGYHVAITLTQFFAVIALLAMASTELMSSVGIAFWVAVVFYMLRQPLMNMGNPILSEFTMNFVGEKNREVTSALQQGVWAGSWFFSGQIFSLLRSLGYEYFVIFSVTAVIYLISITWYALLIQRAKLSPT